MVTTVRERPVPPDPSSLYKDYRRNGSFMGLVPKIPEETRKKHKLYTLTVKDLATGEQVTPTIIDYDRVGYILDLYCPDLLSEQFFFYRNKLLSLAFLSNTAEIVFESGIFHDDIPVIEFGPKCIFWFRALYCESISLVVKMLSCSKKKPAGYQPLRYVPTN